MRSVGGGPASNAALLDRCPRDCSRTPVVPAHVTKLPRSTTCVYQCPVCGHSWFANFWPAAVGTEVGAEPVRIGDAL